MEKLDRLVWAEGVSVRAYGVQLGLRASEPGVLEPLLARLPPEWKPAASPFVERMYSYVAGGHAPGPCLEALEVDARHTVAALSPQRVFVHAGVVGLRGGAIVIPGASFSGKTTLVAELVRRGASYY